MYEIDPRICYVIIYITLNYRYVCIDIGVRVGVSAGVGFNTISEGLRLGTDDGSLEGEVVGVVDGLSLGAVDGITDGDILGLDDGISEGIDDGLLFGTDDG